MKTATLPALRVSPDLRADAESVLRADETLSSFMEDAVRRTVHSRKCQAEFLARGLRSMEDVRNGGKTYPVEVVMAELRAMTDAHMAKKTVRARKAT